MKMDANIEDDAVIVSYLKISQIILPQLKTKYYCFYYQVQQCRNQSFLPENDQELNRLKETSDENK